MVSDYYQKTLANIRAQKGYYTPREVSELYHVTTQTVCNWCRAGVLKAYKSDPITKKAKGERTHWRIYPEQIEEIEVRRDDLIEESRRYWVRLYVKRFLKQ